ncbi:MAG: SWIM zinc finger family protein [Micropruina sp.]|uniref:SWIM zinc finger family protein n=1 Tax=Micropruina sp. TaxID=2737536 RepID=UPI0039E7257B
MGVRSFSDSSTLAPDGLALALAPALTPSGLADYPSFFHGFATHPQVLARGLVTLADVTATRYFQYTPTSQRDPVLTAHGDRLRAECFSACNGVYARLDLLAAGFDGGEIGNGTTNVDLGTEMRRMLTSMGRTDLLHVDVGHRGVRVATPEMHALERPVEMPPRWVRALGNAAELHRDLVLRFTLDAAASRSLIASLPAVTSAPRSGWLTPSPTGFRVAQRASGTAVFVSGLHRLTALKRLVTHVRSLTVYGPRGGGQGPALVEAELPAGRLTLGLTDEAWRGYSGEGSLLTGLAGASAVADADLVCALLAFEPVIDVSRLIRDSGLSEERVRSALAVLAASGRVGWDGHDAAYFHRELPSEAGRLERDNPRLRSARELVAVGAVRRDGDGYLVRSGGDDYVVGLATDTGSCTCRWFLRHGGGRGPCKHVLAARLVADVQ